MKIDLTTEELNGIMEAISFFQNYCSESDKLGAIELKIMKALNGSLTKEQKVKNILAFLAIIFGEDADLARKIMNFSPDYLLEKYERYIDSTAPEHEYGLHPLLRNRLFEPYLIKWGMKCSQD